MRCLLGSRDRPVERACAMDSSLGALPRLVCLSLSLASILGCSCARLSFREEPVSATQRPGGPVLLRCSAQPEEARVSWLWEGRPLDPAALPPELELRPGALAIRALHPPHTGRYFCVAQLGSRAIASRNAHITIAEISAFRDLPRRLVKAEEGGTALIRCQLPPSTPPAVPRFRVRGQWLEQSTGDFFIFPSGSLQIRAVSPQHQGTYRCGAHNPVTQETRLEPHGQRLAVTRPADPAAPAPLRIVYPTSPQTVSVVKAQPLVLECIVAGRPAPAVRWTREGRQVALGPGRRLQHHSLVLDSAARSDGGAYRCSARDQTGRVVSADYTVEVLEPASVSQGLSDRSVSVGSSVNFTCASRGNPAPNVTWLLDSAPLAPSPRLQLSGSSLRIASAGPQDQGVYQCLVDNGIGSAQSSGMLTVQSAPLETSTVGVAPEAPPSAHPVQSDEGEEPPAQEEGLGGSLAPPTERTSDTPTPEAPIITSPPQTHKPDVYDLEWRAGRDWGSPIIAYFVKYRKLDEMGTVLGGWHTVRVPGSEKALRLSELEPSSLYEVLMVARSAGGDGQPAMLTFRTGKERSGPSSRSPHPQGPSPPAGRPEKLPASEALNTHFGVVVHDRVPEAPDRPTISMATESSVYVTWIPRANGGSPITAFRVEYRKQGRSADWVPAADNISPLKLSVEVRSLEPGATYRFRVIAINTYGESPHSAPSRPYHVPAVSTHFTTRPVAGPHISSTDAVSDTQIILRWTYTPSSNNNTPIQGFYIYYRPTDSDNDSDYKRDVVEGNKQWHLIGQLQPETSYDIKMQCFNDGGESEYSNVMICETKARQAPGVSPGGGAGAVTPPGPPERGGGGAGGVQSQRGGDMLYLIVGSVLGVMVLILLAFIAMCLWRSRQQSSLHKYDPPGYLYQPAEMSSHVLEYAALPGTSHANGGLRPLPGGCPHLHHKLPGGPPLLAGAHRPHNGGGVYTALPQSDPSDCMSCQNFCNNNRCYTKTNGTFSNGTLPMMHHMSPCQQDGLEMMPLAHVTPGCDTPTVPQCPGELGEEGEKGSMTLPPSQHSCCQAGEYCQLGGRGEELHCREAEGPVLVCWETRGPPVLDCPETAGWISTGTAMDRALGDFSQPELLET
uniref:Cell adhesion associated, oncogene regulated n=1 Tax=Lepisosteus oculatus TaxID=7918 RepID=W5LY09_LEPOC|nr:PREDICTED: cell adhesion molecule-related/down-regulated by oncogenes isoform X1 [Lepisosteus oculatus]